MTPDQIRKILEDFKAGALSSDDALDRLRTLPFEDLGFANIDTHRSLRQGFPEVIFGAGKTAEQLVRILKRGRPVTMRLTLVSQRTEGGHSGNVIAEVPGRDAKAPILLVGGHLDSWDLATGAIDDGAGIAITTAAAKHIMDAGRPLRTIRVVWFGAEEPGGFGGKAYAAAHGKERYAIAGESDFGADRVWRHGLRHQRAELSRIRDDKKTPGQDKRSEEPEHRAEKKRNHERTASARRHRHHQAGAA